MERTKSWCIAGVKACIDEEKELVDAGSSKCNVRKKFIILWYRKGEKRHA